MTSTGPHVVQDELVAVRQQLQGAQGAQHRLQQALEAAQQSLDGCYQQLQDSQVRFRPPAVALWLQHRLSTAFRDAGMVH